MVKYVVRDSKTKKIIRTQDGNKTLKKFNSSGKVTKDYTKKKKKSSSSSSKPKVKVKTPVGAIGQNTDGSFIYSKGSNFSSASGEVKAVNSNGSSKNSNLITKTINNSKLKIKSSSKRTSKNSNSNSSQMTIKQRVELKSNSVTRSKQFKEAVGTGTKARDEVVSYLNKYQNWLKTSQANKMTAAQKESTRLKYLNDLEKNQSANISDSVKKGFLIGSAQILRNPLKYKADEDVQDAVDILTKPVQTVKDTAKYIAAAPLTYLGEIGAEYAVFGSAEAGLKKLRTKGAKFSKGAGKEFVKIFGSKKKVGKYAAKKLALAGSGAAVGGVGAIGTSLVSAGMTARDVYKVIKAGYLASTVIKKGETKKAFETRVENKIKSDLKINKNGKKITETNKTKPSTNTKGKDKNKKTTNKPKKTTATTKLKVLSAIKTKKSSKTGSKSKKVTKAKKKPVTKTKVETKKKTTVKVKEKKKVVAKTKQKAKVKEKKKVEVKTKEKKKTKQKVKLKTKAKTKLKVKLKKVTIPKTTVKKKVSLQLDSGKKTKTKTVKAAKKKAVKYLKSTKGLQKATIKTTKKIKTTPKTKNNIKYSVSTNKKKLTLTETKKRVIKKKTPTKKKTVVKKKPIKKKTIVKKKVVKKKTTTKRKTKR